VAGAFFMNQDAVFQLDVPYPALGPQYVNGLTVNSYAAYGDATYAVTDALFLTFGARVGLEGNDGFWRCLGPTPTNAFCPGSANLNHTWRNFSPRAVIRYALTPDSNVYASITRGYKAGLINVSGFQEDPIGAERITSYEVGYKLAANNTRFSASGFYYDYKGLQSEFYTETTNVITNAASSEIYGGEASITQNIGNFSTTVGVAYTHAIYLDYPGAPSSTFDFATGTVSTTPVNASGKTLLAAPRWSGNIGATYTIPAAVFEGDVALNANLYFTSRNYFDATDVHYQNSYQLLNLRATWTSEDERYSLALWGNNVTGTQYLNQAGGFGYATGVTYGAPPTYGATFGFKFR
jgi:iron complex outermembrane receptor protein